MKTRDDIIALLKHNKQELVERFKLRKIGLFGSYARNRQDMTSDVDILVDVPPSIGLDFVILAERIEELLGMSTDVVTIRAIKKKKLEHIQKDLIYV